MFARPCTHGPIREIFPDIFFVSGINLYTDQNGEQQHSRNMVIVRENGILSLINTVRLEEAGLRNLEALGKVQHVIRLGAFHGRDDGFYQDRYQATLWAIPGMQYDEPRTIDVELLPEGSKPFSACSLFLFQHAAVPEGILHLDREGGMLITCDSIKNWLQADEFFSEKTAEAYEKANFFGQARVSKMWREHCQVKLADFLELKRFPFKHLLSAHGEPLLNLDKTDILASIEKQYNSGM